MDLKQADHIEYIVSEYLNDKNAVIEKDNSPVRIVKKAEKDILLRKDTDGETGEWLRDNYYLLKKECFSLKKTFLPKKYYMKISGEKTPLLLNIMIAVFKKCDLPVSYDTVCKIITEIQKYVLLEYEDFLSCSPFIRTCAIIIAAESIKEDSPLGMKKAVEAIKFSEGLSINGIIEKYSCSEQIMKNEKSGVYNLMDEESKAYYRGKLSVLAKIREKTEPSVAAEIVKESGEVHLGAKLLDAREFTDKRKLLRRLYLITRIFVPAATSILLFVFYRNFLLSLLSLMPVYFLLRRPTENLFLRLSDNIMIPKIKIGNQLTNDERTAAVVSLMLDKSASEDKIVGHIESLYRKSPKGEMYFVLLCDLPEANRKVSEGDAPILEKAQVLTDRLNEITNGHCVTFIRRRSYSDTMKKYLGKNRKRGAVCDLTAFATGHAVKFYKTVGNTEIIKKCRFFILLDSDTDLTLLAAQKLIGAAKHPFNAPKIADGEIVSGYGVITPYVGIVSHDVTVNLFTRLFSYEQGISTYTFVRRSPDKDLTGTGRFCGKGIIEPAVFYTMTKDFFKDEEVLSHDIIEGLVLKTGYASDITLCDGFPGSFNGYLKRSDRWIRGDWQNILFLAENIKNRKYEKIKNPFTADDKIKLGDNCLRSTEPLFSVLALISSYFFYGKVSKLMFLLGVVHFAWEILSAVCGKLKSGNVTTRSFNKMPPAARRLLLSLINLSFLPVYAYRNIKSALTGSFRILISKKNMLQWTTAEKSESERDNMIKLCFPSVVSGLFFLTSFRWYHRALGTVFVMSLLFYEIMKKRTEKENVTLNAEQRYVLSVDAEKMWNFFETYVTEEDHFLPPDNVEFSPKYEVAHRTSPTNIGLYLLSIYGAFRLGLTDKSGMESRIARTLDTVDKLDKYKGHLYNWYNTKTLNVLTPSYVSTVDSGNYICSLITLRNGLDNKELIARINEIIDSTDFLLLYDTEKELFSIGLNPEDGKISPHYYDMLMSESRMTGYMAIARGIVPKKHWTALGRLRTVKNGYTGTVSWTGTAFEYFMSTIFMPTFENTLFSESLKYAVYCQKLKAAENGTPMGISESGFYAFDNVMNYQYKAHGTAALGLKRGLDRENVVSPYSTYLMMNTDFKTMYRNRSRMFIPPLVGKFGLYEAVDFTPTRLSGEKFKVIKTYMSHHVAMSFLSLVNILDNNSVQKAFMSDSEMATAEELLLSDSEEYFGIVAEKTPECKAEPNRRTVPEITECENYSPISPKTWVLSSGDMTFIDSDVGASYIRYKDITVTRPPEDIFGGAGGITAMITVGGKTQSICEYPFYDGRERRTRFSSEFSSHYIEDGNFYGGVSYSIAQSIPVLKCETAFKNVSKEKVTGYIDIFFQPILSDYEKYRSHKAFSDLFIYHKEEKNKVLFGRKGDDSAFLAVYAPMGEFSFSREKILSREYGINSYFHMKDGSKEGIPSTACLIRIPFSLAPRERFDGSVYLGMGDSEKEAFQNIEISLKTEEKSLSFLGTGSPEAVLCESVLGQMIYGVKDGYNLTLMRKYNTGGTKELYSCSLSGDVPIVYFEMNGENDVNRLEAYIRMWKNLKLYRIVFDLCIGVYDVGYRSPCYDSAFFVCEKENVTSFIGERGGIHFIGESVLPEITVSAIKASAVHLSGKSVVRMGIPTFPFKKISVKNCERGISPYTIEAKDRCGGFTDNGYVINKTPRVPFSAIYCDENGGTLVTESSLGYTYSGNARENRLTDFMNDGITEPQNERLVICVDGVYYDPISGSTAFFSEDKAEYFGICGGIKTKVTVCYDGEKKISVFLSCDEKKNVSVCYYLQPCLGDGKRKETNKCKVTENGICVYNPFSEYGTLMTVKSNKECEKITDKADFLSGKWHRKNLSTEHFLCAALVYRTEPEKEDSVDFSVSCDTHTDSQSKSGKITVHTDDVRLDTFYNVFLPMQIKKGRINGRVGFYQCGGAYGFRDQLQDVLSLMLWDKDTAYRQIIKSASRQFPEGDVLHWWHEYPEKTVGLRSRCSDDLLWLPYVAAEYVSVTGDTEFIKTPVEFCEGEKIAENKTEIYEEVKLSSEKYTLYEHCVRAIIKGYNIGPHGLLKIGTGDWNDGYNKLGVKGKGESVWLTMFFILVLRKMAPLAKLMDDGDFLLRLKTMEEELMPALYENAWNGEYFIRAYNDAGDPVGDKENDECKIDILPQCFSAFLEMKKEMVLSSFNAVRKYLWDEENGIIKLLDPPFCHDDPGYISDYPMGVRENGGQYTHAALWFSQALYKAGETDLGYKALKTLMPFGRDDNYEVEPYFTAADVYSGELMSGRGGWTLYTGSAGWMHRIFTENVFGITKSGDKLFINPHIPSDIVWKGATVDTGSEIIEIYAEPCDRNELSVNGKKAEFITLDGKNKEVKIKYKYSL